MQTETKSELDPVADEAALDEHLLDNARASAAKMRAR